MAQREGMRGADKVMRDDEKIGSNARNPVTHQRNSTFQTSSGDATESLLIGESPLLSGCLATGLSCRRNSIL